MKLLLNYFTESQILSELFLSHCFYFQFPLLVLTSDLHSWKKLTVGFRFLSQIQSPDEFRAVV